MLLLLALLVLIGFGFVYSGVAYGAGVRDFPTQGLRRDRIMHLFGMALALRAVSGLLAYSLTSSQLAAQEENYLGGFPFFLTTTCIYAVSAFSIGQALEIILMLSIPRALYRQRWLQLRRPDSILPATNYLLTFYFLVSLTLGIVLLKFGIRIFQQIPTLRALPIVWNIGAMFYLTGVILCLIPFSPGLAMERLLNIPLPRSTDREGP